MPDKKKPDNLREGRSETGSWAWDFFCPGCCELLDGEMGSYPDDPDESEKKCQGKFYYCMWCDIFISFDTGGEIEIEGRESILDGIIHGIDRDNPDWFYDPVIKYLTVEDLVMAARGRKIDEIRERVAKRRKDGVVINEDPDGR